MTVTRVSLALAGLALMVAGCATGHPAPVAKAPANATEIVFYLDGAGGGGLVTNWGRHVRKGLREAGYAGIFKEFDWETGMGVVADQVSSDAYKRKRAGTLAHQITDYARHHPRSRINVMALSAGTAVAIFALEQLPPSQRVSTVVLLSSSLSSDYDLTMALRHVRGYLYATTSTRDDILSIAVPMFGTADRRNADLGVAGIEGFRLPPDANSQTIRLYRKIRYIPWRPEYDAEGDFGTHTGTTVPPFIRGTIAPLIMTGDRAER